MTGVYDTALSDHHLIYTVFSKSFVRKERAHKEIKFRNYRNFSPEEFRKELLENDSISQTLTGQNICFLKNGTNSRMCFL